MLKKTGKNISKNENSASKRATKKEVRKYKNGRKICQKKSKAQKKTSRNIGEKEKPKTQTIPTKKTKIPLRGIFIRKNIFSKIKYVLPF